MIEINNENILFVDVDGTLITKSKDPYQQDSIEFYNYGLAERHTPILEHVELIKKNKFRGQYIIVWSQNGVKWAKEVVTKLGLADFVDMVMTKPSIYVDDLPVNEWAQRIFLGEK